MQQQHLPVLGLRFWVALSIASVFGANMGDFFAHVLGLGHVDGLPFLAVAFALILIVERFDRVAHEGYYWIAIVVVRTAATNLADFFCGDLKLPRPMVMAALAAVLILLVAGAWTAWRRSEKGTGDLKTLLLRGDAAYWASMLVAGTLGTVLGDYFSHNLHLGDGGGALALSAVLAALALVGVTGLIWLPLSYWVLIVMVRAAGTCVGDFVASRAMMGLALSTAVTGVTFLIVLLLWKDRRARVVSP